MRARAAVATVIAEGLVGRLTFGMVSFALPLYAFALGLSLRQIGLLVSIRTLVVLPFKPVAGWFADRVGMRTVYLAGIAVRAASAVVLLLAGGFEGLMLVRVLQGASSAARDVASLGTIARESGNRIGAHYGWYAAAKQVGNVTGAAAAGLLIALGGGRHAPEAYRPLFLLVLALSAAPFVVAWFGLREDPRVPRAAIARPPAAARRGRAALHELRALAGASSVGMLVATSAYMVHGLYPVLATQYAHLSEVQAGAVYSASGLAFVVAAPSFGWLIDRRGRPLALALRSLCNIGSSIVYVAAPSLPGMAAARTIDDSGKAAFQPAWATVVAETAGNGVSSGRRLATLDTAATVGEAIGPALAMVLWQSGGIFLLFGVRIVISAAAEIAALRVFGERRVAVVPVPAEAS